MLKYSYPLARAGMVAAIVSCAAVASAQPSVSSSSGTWAHAGSVTVQGSGFGSKASAAPVVWDDASGSNLAAKWSGAWPSRGNAINQMQYRQAPFRNVSGPHSRVNRFLAGAAAENGGYDAGWNVIVYKARTNFSRPGFSYLSWYERADPAWVFGQGSPADDNFKMADWTEDSSPYGPGWYLTQMPAITSLNSTGGGWAAAVPGNTQWGGQMTNLHQQWVKVEVMARWSSGSDGFYRVWDNGRQVINYSGPTDTLSGSTRTDAIGGYVRSTHANNYRYFTDLYVDYTLQHVVLGNASTFTACTRREAQIPTAWSSSSVTLTVNLGGFTQGQTAYVYVFDANGNVNANGLPITVGGAGGGTPPPPPTPPAAPTNVRIVTP